MAGCFESLEYLVRGINRVMGSGVFHVWSLLESTDGQNVNVTTVLKFAESQNGRVSGFQEIPHTNMKILKGMVDVEAAFDLVKDALENAQFDFRGQTVYLDQGEHTIQPSQNSSRIQSALIHGTVDSTSSISYTSRESLPIVPSGFRLMGVYPTISEMIWFEALSVDGTRPNNLSSPIVRNRGVHMVVPHWYARLKTVQVTDDEVSIELDSNTDRRLWDLVRIRVTMHYHDNTVSRSTIHRIDQDGRCIIPSKKKTIRSAEVDALLLPEGGSELCWIDTKYGEKLASATNVRFGIHKFFDPDSQTLRDSLLKPQDNSTAFEWAVAVLLHLAGYEVEWWDFPQRVRRLKTKPHEVDVIAVDSAARKILAVECTTSEGDLGKKISSVGARAAELKATCPEDWYVLPVVCIPLTEAQRVVAGYGSFAGLVRILDADSLRRTLNFIESGYTHDALAKELTGQSS